MTDKMSDMRGEVARALEHFGVQVHPVAGVPGFVEFIPSFLPPDKSDPFCRMPRVTLERCAECWSLNSLYVPLGYRRAGVARALMDAALKYAGEMLPVLLETRPFGPEAPTVAELRVFYAKFGFERWPLHPVSMCRWPGLTCAPVVAGSGMERRAA